jgi:hypothetical protein
MVQHYFQIFLVGVGSGTAAWFLLDWIGAFPEDEG